MPCEVISLTVQMTISPGSGMLLPCSEVIIETPDALASLIEVSAASRASSRRCLGFSPSSPGFPRASSLTPQEEARSFPLLYRETECRVCFLHDGQKVRISFGNFNSLHSGEAAVSSLVF